LKAVSYERRRTNCAEFTPQSSDGRATQGPEGRPGPRSHPEESALYRFLGGSPGAVLLRLIFVSLIVGAFLMWLDIRPADIFRALKELADRVWAMGFDAIREIADYILAGAAIVVPVWLVLRLLSVRNAR
jgi:hypothetical protein